ncbi:MAG TPA: hypothetical protein VK574_04810 [Terracidiphilus sp.]|nr:hypothetical protein [Terracidiphilus sp.]
MTKNCTQSLADKSLKLLSRLLLSAKQSDVADNPFSAELKNEVVGLSRPEFDCLVALAETNHVLVRGLGAFREITLQAGDAIRTSWADVCLSAERARINLALSYLSQICDAFTRNQLRIAVIKSLDHLPDLGSDLDLYTNAKPEEVIRLMEKEFGASPASRSWGDRLACKWNFIVPRLPELVEIHIGRLGQTGEQFAIADSLLDRTRCISIGELLFRVPSISDRLMVSTLQRMYRHFYFRLCDIVDSASLVETGSIDYDDLCVAATTAGIWEGVTTYLAIVSDYVHRYRGAPLDIPNWVIAGARFRGTEVYFAKDFLRVPILPQSAKLYGSQLARVIRRRQFESGARLSLLPWLATAALVGQKITGSDKGIW